MNRYKEATRIFWVDNNLDHNIILRLETTLINQGRVLETDKLEYDKSNDLIVICATNDSIEKNLVSNKYPLINLMDTGSSTIPSRIGNPTLVYSASNLSIGQPSRTPYNDYRDEKDYERPRGKRLPLELVKKKLLVDAERILNLAAHDLQKLPIVIKVWSKLVCRKFDELEVEKTTIKMYSYLEKFFGETARIAWGAYKQKFWFSDRYRFRT